MDAQRNVLRMNEGSDDKSYAKNSQVQKKIISIAKHIIEEAIRDFYCNTLPESMGIADLGCSSGLNTFLLMSEIIAAVEEMARQMHRPLPEFRVFFNDLLGNDFNTLFKSLPAFYCKLKKDKGSNSNVFIAAVPGSFYGRLFPNRSLAFFNSSSCLHWLSQVPPELDVKVSPPLNKGKTYISKTSPTSVINAYVAQFRRDFSLFLKSRSEEMVAGGRMVLILMGRSTEDPISEENCYKWDVLAQALNDMVLEGLLEKEKVDSFNVPFYSPSLEELKFEIQTEGSFVLHRQEVLHANWDGMDSDNVISKEMGTPAIIHTKGELTAKTVRAVVEPMLKTHFGEELMEDLFGRLARIVDENWSEEIAKFSNFVLSLIRKG